MEAQTTAEDVFENVLTRRVYCDMFRMMMRPTPIEEEKKE